MKSERKMPFLQNDENALTTFLQPTICVYSSTKSVTRLSARSVVSDRASETDQQIACKIGA